MFGGHLLEFMAGNFTHGREWHFFKDKGVVWAGRGLGDAFTRMRDEFLGAEARDSPN